MQRTSWSASIPLVRLRLVGESGEFVTGGATFNYETPQDQVAVTTGTRTFLSVQGGSIGEGYQLEVQAPRGRALTPGRYSGARRYPFNEGRPGISITGDHRGCNEVSGEFTVHASSFDRRGRLKSIRLSFVHLCEGRPPAITGSLSYRR